MRRTLYTVPLLPAEVRTEFLREAKLKNVELEELEGEFFLGPADAPNLIWATDVTHDATIVEIPSIAAGAKNLRAAVKREWPDLKKWGWVLLPGTHHRRATLIASELRAKEATPLSFPESRQEAPSPFIGFFLTATDRAVLVLNSLTPSPGGGIEFREEKVGPPSRAYLKIWEALTRVKLSSGVFPASGDVTVDLGSCPGGWTWALAKLGCICLSVDGAAIDDSVLKMPGVRFLKSDAFKLSPEAVCRELGVKKIDWVFSDMICEPKRLAPFLKAWLDSGVCENFIISVKFKGEADLAAIRELDGLGGGKLRHLRQNKHEVTWFRVPGLKRI
ncbi:MAG: hypothetical protein H7301_14790 [Cryobacterium sp.]|nr:hypothetical protein [Oligoflexia bacterium]